MMESAAKQAGERARELGGRMKAERGGVVVLDFGGQYTQLIARRIREQQVFSAVLPCTSSIEEIRKLEPAGIILSGGPS
jgi:GMP synthase (glutamine-hydrolysing)